MSREIKILLGANEDGFGPMMGVFHLVNGLFAVSKEFGCEVRVIIQNLRAQSLLRDLIRNEFDPSDRGRIEHSPVEGSIVLGKRYGMVDIDATRPVIINYENQSKKYAQESQVNLEQADAVISFGTPELLKAAKQVEDEAKKRILRFEVFDHSWYYSLWKIFSEELKKRNQRLEDDEELIAALEKIKADEALADRVWLFPEFLTAAEYYCHWKGILQGKPVERMPGVFGGFDPDEREQARKECRVRLRKDLKLEIKRSDKIIVIQAGGTPVWDDFLANILRECHIMISQRTLQNLVILFSEMRVRDLLQGERARRLGREGVERITQLIEQAKKNKRIGMVPTGDFLANWQKLYIGVDEIFSRAGGMTVQDAVACGVPVVCVDEPGQWQTEKIKETCRLEGIAPTASYSAFTNAPIGPILRYLHDEDIRKKAQIAMSTYPPHCERLVAREILKTILKTRKN